MVDSVNNRFNVYGPTCPAQKPAPQGPQHHPQQQPSAPSDSVLQGPQQDCYVKSDSTAPTPAPPKPKRSRRARRKARRKARRRRIFGKIKKGLKGVGRFTGGFVKGVFKTVGGWITNPMSAVTSFMSGGPWGMVVQAGVGGAVEGTKTTVKGVKKDKAKDAQKKEQQNRFAAYA